MAENILSQEEVDALLRGVVAGEVDTEPKEEDPGALRRSIWGRKSGSFAAACRRST